jgi:hypothetical protein
MLSQMIQKIWGHREDRYSELRDAMLREKQNRPLARAKVEMSYIGG